MPELEAMLTAIVRDPLAEDRWLVLADWLEEYDDPRRAELLRLHRKLLATCCEPRAHPARVAWQALMVELLAKGVQPCVLRRSVVLAEGVEMGFNFIPPGRFLMGSPASEPERADDETQQHQVTLTSGYWMGIHLVTKAQSRAVMGGTPTNFQGKSLPVENVSWNDCQDFVAKLGQKTGQQFRLPTEAEWEHACRAGTTTPFHLGETICTEQANYNGKRTYGEGRKGIDRGKAMPVGGFSANAWGLYDMHGNVWEWCSDIFVDNSSEGSGDLLQGGHDDGARLLRGGSWYDDPSRCRSAAQQWSVRGARFVNFGCRVVLCLD